MIPIRWHSSQKHWTGSTDSEAPEVPQELEDDDQEVEELAEWQKSMDDEAIALWDAVTTQLPNDCFRVAAPRADDESQSGLDQRLSVRDLS